MFLRCGEPGSLKLFLGIFSGKPHCSTRVSLMFTSIAYSNDFLNLKKCKKRRTHGKSKTKLQN
jgi:hypothetical protein